VFDPALLRQEVKFLSYPLAATRLTLNNPVNDPVTPLAVAALIAAAFFVRGGMLGELTWRDDALPLSTTSPAGSGWADISRLEAGTPRRS
jgi:hypothetical protein